MESGHIIGVGQLSTNSDCSGSRIKASFTAAAMELRRAVLSLQRRLKARERREYHRNLTLDGMGVLRGSILSRIRFSGLILNSIILCTTTVGVREVGVGWLNSGCELRFRMNRA